MKKRLLAFFLLLWLYDVRAQVVYDDSSILIEKDGLITNVEIKQEVHPLLDAEALRVISAMPNWNPGIKNGKPERVRIFQPITFKLD